MVDDGHTRLLLYVVRFHATRRRGPTYTEMSAELGRSRNWVHRALGDLQRLGLVDWEPTRYATLRPKVRIVQVGAEVVTGAAEAM